MAEGSDRSIVAWLIGGLCVAAGVAAFAIPLHHAGPYSLPGRGLFGGLACFAIAALLFLPSTPRALRLFAVLLSPVILFIALYGALAELEEVVVLRAKEANLRLWIVDHAGGEWVSMPRSKAAANGLEGARLEVLRAGETRCVVPRIVDDPVANRRTFDLRQEKYAVQRLAVSIGLFGDGPSAETITLRLDPCPEG